MKIFDINIKKADGSIENITGDSQNQGQEEEKQPMVVPLPKPPPQPGEGAFSFPRTAEGQAPSIHSGARPEPAVGSAPRPEGSAPIRRSGGRPMFRVGQSSIAEWSPEGDTHEQQKFGGHNAQGVGASFNWSSKPSEVQAQKVSEMQQAMNRSLSGGAFCILIKGDRPVTPIFKIKGISIRLENPVGSIRQGKSKEGYRWKTVMTDDYGFIVGVPGVDGDMLDVFVGPEARKIRDTDEKEGSFDKVWIIHARNPQTNKYDEDKVMFGYPSKEQAVASYRRHYDSPDEFLGPVSEYSLDEFKKQLKNIKKNKKASRIGRGSFVS